MEAKAATLEAHTALNPFFQVYIILDGQTGGHPAEPLNDF